MKTKESIELMRSSLQEFVDYYADMKPILNDELQAMLDRAEEAIKADQ